VRTRPLYTNAPKDGHGYTRGYLRAYPYPDPQKPYPCTGRV
jgi:hypothetical protein